MNRRRAASENETMSEHWQDILAVSLAALAGVYLARRLWLVLGRKTGGACGGGCGHCPASKSSDPQIVELEMKASPTRTTTAAR